ncbi:hypothetical protein A2V82_03775 [candidate division KSB1 bacterium RBG_16_48_16]|nr:MAG: hypothetical protein A2V82_03775 [candidate division KSB1 bacterium RBG_16_48_16]
MPILLFLITIFRLKRHKYIHFFTVQLQSRKDKTRKSGSYRFVYPCFSEGKNVSYNIVFMRNKMLVIAQK